MIDKNNPYYCARMEAAQNDPLFSSRDRAAGALHISPEALIDYESGKTVPRCDIVQRMVDIYGIGAVKGDHIRAHCPLLPDYGGNSSELAQAALGWAVAFASAQEIALRFATVARDGKITADELPAAQMIRAKAVEVRRVMEESISAIDQAVADIARGASI